MTEGKGGAACCLSGLCALPLLIPSSLQAHRLLPHDSPATLGAESTLSDYRAAILSLMSSEWMRTRYMMCLSLGMLQSRLELMDYSDFTTSWQCDASPAFRREIYRIYRRYRRKYRDISLDWFLFPKLYLGSITMERSKCENHISVCVLLGSLGVWGCFFYCVGD